MTDASIIDLLSALQNGVQAINALQVRIADGNSFVAGDVTAINSLSGTAIQVIEQNPDRTFLTFHNPSSAVTAYVYPMLTADSTSLTHVASSPGGSFVILPQDYLQFSGGCQTAWLAFSSSGSNNPLTVVSA